jgi:hypothetical protein
MNRFYSWAKVVLVLTAIVAIGLFAWMEWSARNSLAGELRDLHAGMAAQAQQLTATQQQVQTVGLNTALALSAVTQTLNTVNRPCGVRVNGFLQPCGTLADFAELMKTYQHTATLINVAFLHEDRQLSMVDGRLGTTFDSLDAAMGRVNKLLDSSKTTVDDADKFINAPALAATVENFKTMSAGLAVTSGNMGAVSSDFRVKFHDFLYPPKCLTKMCKVKRVWPYVHGASELAEPGYWGYELFKAVP